MSQASQAAKAPIGAILVFRGPRTGRVAAQWRVVGRSYDQIRVEVVEDHAPAAAEIGARVLLSRTVSADVFAGRTEFVAACLPEWAESRLPA